MTDTDTPNPGDLRFWWVPQIPMTAFERRIPNVATGVLLMDAFADYDQFQFDNNVKPDYSNTGGIARWEYVGDEFDWVDVDDEEIEAAKIDPLIVLDGVDRTRQASFPNGVIEQIKPLFLAAHPNSVGVGWGPFNDYIEQLRKVGYL